MRNAYASATQVLSHLLDTLEVLCDQPEILVDKGDPVAENAVRMMAQ